MSKTEREVNLTKMTQPSFVTLTGLPANQIGFKVVRDASGAEKKVPHMKRTRQQRSDALLSIHFELGVTEEDAGKIADEYGLQGYAVSAHEDGTVSIKRTDTPADAQTMTINIGSGRKAEILKPTSVQRGISLVSVDFAKDYFETDTEAKAWLAQNGIDFEETRVQNGDLAIRAMRQDIEADTETRQVKVDDGVVFVVTRSEITDIPAGYSVGVVEAAYGQWGWGQLDFAAAMADIEFCNMVEEGTYRLRSVLDSILFYSQLPLALRKELVANATAQFAEFVGALMDALPAQVVLVNRNDKEKLMGQKQEQKDVARTDDAAKAATGNSEGGAAAAADAAKGDSNITRADVEKMIGDAVTGIGTQIEALSAKIAPPAAAGEAAQRSDGQGETKADPMVEAMTSIAKSVESVSESVKSVNTTVDALAQRLDKLESATVVRSDAGDGKQTTQRKDTFAGVFSGRGKSE